MIHSLQCKPTNARYSLELCAFSRCFNSHIMYAIQILKSQEVEYQYVELTKESSVYSVAL
jgi:hypothetical protein